MRTAIMLKILCLCLFVARCINSKGVDDEETKRRMFAYFAAAESSWVSESFEDPDIYGTRYYNPAVNIIEHAGVQRTTYTTEIRVQQTSHPYLFSLMEIIPIKWKISFQFVYQKLFKLFIALQRFQIIDVKNILQFVFPEMSHELIAKLALEPPGPRLLRALFTIILPGTHQDLDAIFKNAHTSVEVVINLILYLCPNIRENVQWNDKLPLRMKLILVLDILFPGVNIGSLLKTDNFDDFPKLLYHLLELLFTGKLTSNPVPDLQSNAWMEFHHILSQNHIDIKFIPQDYVYYLFANYKRPDFIQILPKIREKYVSKAGMDDATLKLWRQYLLELRTRQKTLYDMPQEIKIFIQQYKNPKELIKDLSINLGFEVSVEQLDIPLDPQIEELWKKFILNIMTHNGDPKHLPPQLLEYFKSLSHNSNYKIHLDTIFDSLSINPKLALKWNTFFQDLQDGQTSLDQIPSDLKVFLINNPNPEQFLKIIFKLKDSKVDLKFLDVEPDTEMVQLWKQYIKDVADQKPLKHIPKKLLEYFYKLSHNPNYVEYIKVIFGPDKIPVKTLNLWQTYISKLRTHEVDLQDMPPEIIQLMLKYKSPDEFLKVVIPDLEINAAPSSIVQEKWQDWTHLLKANKTTIYDTPDELKQYFYNVSPKESFQNTLNEIYSISPVILQQWRSFVVGLKQHTTSLKTLPLELKQYFDGMTTPKDLVRLIFNGLQPPLKEPLKDMPQNVGFTTFKLNVEANPELMRDLRLVSQDLRYQRELNVIFQIDQKLKIYFEEFEKGLEGDFTVSLKDVPAPVKQFLKMWDHRPDEGLQLILAAYDSNQLVHRLNEDELQKYYLNPMPQKKDIIKKIVSGTVLEGKVGRVLRTMERNTLIQSIDHAWKEAKLQPDTSLAYFFDKIGRLEICEYQNEIIVNMQKVVESLDANVCHNYK